MWAQLPWLQIGVKQASPTLIMDIVSMKLASSALIFLVSLDIDFTINFLNRCRVNAINGVQVFTGSSIFPKHDSFVVYNFLCTKSKLINIVESLKLFFPRPQLHSLFLISF